MKKRNTDAEEEGGLGAEGDMRGRGEEKRDRESVSVREKACRTSLFNLLPVRMALSISSPKREIISSYSV